MDEGFDSGGFDAGMDVVDSSDISLDVDIPDVEVDSAPDTADTGALPTDDLNVVFSPIGDAEAFESVSMDAIGDEADLSEVLELDASEDIISDDELFELQSDADALEPLALEQEDAVDIPDCTDDTDTALEDVPQETVEYESNGYQYVADTNGRILNASGELRLEGGERDPRAQLEAGGEFRHEKDDGGHLIGTRFGGSGELDNLIAQDSNLNRSGFKSMENEWARELENGNDVKVSIEPIYQDGTDRPHAIMGEYTVMDSDGEAQTEHFSFTNENLNSPEFELPPEADELMDEVANS